MKPSSWIPKTIAALAVGALLGATGCSSQSDSPQNANAASPSAEAVATPSEVSTPTPTPKPTPKETFGPTWASMVSSPEPLPKRWDGSPGWRVSVPDSKTVTNTEAVEAFSLKKGIAVLTHGDLNNSTVVTYDKNGNTVGTMPEPTELEPARKGKVEVGFMTVKGYPYMMALQTGVIVPDPSSTDKAGTGFVYTSFDGVTGKMVKRGVVPVADFNPVPVTETSTVHISNGFDATIRMFIDPLTGKTTTITDPEWMTRVDGVDLMYSEATGVSGSNWTRPDLNMDAHSPIAGAGRYVTAGVYDDKANFHCSTIDVHTGKEPAWAAQFKNKSCLEELKGINFGLYHYRDQMEPILLNPIFYNPATSKSYTFTESTTFEAGFVGGDGIVYGKSSAVSGVEVPAYLNLNEGAPKTLGDKDTLAPLAVSGDGTAVFRASDGLVFATPVSE